MIARSSKSCRVAIVFYKINRMVLRCQSNTFKVHLFEFVNKNITAVLGTTQILLLKSLIDIKLSFIFSRAAGLLSHFILCFMIWPRTVGAVRPLNSSRFKFPTPKFGSRLIDSPKVLNQNFQVNNILQRSVAH